MNQPLEGSPEIECAVLEREPSHVLRRDAAWPSYSGHEPVQMAHGQLLNLLPLDNSSRKLFVFRRQHMSLLFALARFDLRGRDGQPGTCWDVGANVGFISAFLAARSDVERVLAFEPNPRLLPVLQKNAARYPKIETWGVAVGSAPGSGVLFANDDDSGLSSASLSAVDTSDAVDGESGLLVPMESIDSVSASIGCPVDFIKIDVEGHEPDVLLGASRSIQKWRPLVLLEYHDHPGQRDEIMRAFQQAAGAEFGSYRAHVFDADGVVSPCDEAELIRSSVTDVFFVPSIREFRH